MSSSSSASVVMKTTKLDRRSPRPFLMKTHFRRHIALQFAYCGWNYHGLASSGDGGNTVEDQLLLALERTRMIDRNDEFRMQRCGRTDTGVSALGQVVSLYVRSSEKRGLGVLPPGIDLSDASYTLERLEEETRRLEESEEDTEGSDAEKKKGIDYVAALNGVLPPDIRVYAWSPVRHGFSARFSCLYRHYKYFFLRGSMNIHAMNEACAYLVGEHDFRNFCKMNVEAVKSHIRIIHEAFIRPASQFPDGDTSSDSPFSLYEFNVVGTAFLWHQVRNMIAILFLVGQGHESPAIVSELLDVSKYPGKPVYEMAPPDPLVLFDCGYSQSDIHWECSEQAKSRALSVLMDSFQQLSIRSSVALCLASGIAKSASLDHTDIIDPNSQKKPRARSYQIISERPTLATLEEKLEDMEKKRRKINVDSPIMLQSDFVFAQDVDSKSSSSGT